MNNKLQTFSKKYFEFRKMIEIKFDQLIEKSLEKEKRNFYKKYGVEPKEEDIQEIKKEIVMQKGFVWFVVIALLVILFVS